MVDAKPKPRRPSMVQTERTAKAIKMAQYFRILPCPYTQQMFCYASSLLKWFKIEQMRNEQLSILLESTKHKNQPTTDQTTTDGEPVAEDNGEKTENGESSTVPVDSENKKTPEIIASSREQKSGLLSPKKTGIKDKKRKTIKLEKTGSPRKSGKDRKMEKPKSPIKLETMGSPRKTGTEGKPEKPKSPTKGEKAVKVDRPMTPANTEKTEKGSPVTSAKGGKTEKSSNVAPKNELVEGDGLKKKKRKSLNKTKKQADKIQDEEDDATRRDIVEFDDEEEDEKREEEDTDEDEDEDDEEEEEEDVSQKEEINPIIALTKPCLLRVSYASSTEKRMCFNLAFSAMKYFDLLEKILDEVGFYGEYPNFKDEENLVLVTLYDYTARNYQRRTKSDADREVLPPNLDAIPPKMANRVFIHPPTSEIFLEIEKSVMTMSVHLAASVARIRVKEQVGSLRLLLPLAWREAEEFAEKMPFYAWHNVLLGKSEIVSNWLAEHNFTKVNSFHQRKNEYSYDPVCPDVFIFNHADRTILMESSIIKNHNLVIQDRSNLILLHSLLSFMGGGEEVMFANSSSNLNAVHLEAMSQNKYPMIAPVPTIRVSRQPKEEEDSKMLKDFGAKSVKVVTDDFTTLSPQSENYKNVRHIILEAADTRRSVATPIDYIECENDELAILKDMWTPDGKPQKETRKLELITRTISLLRHALKFNNSRTVIFISHSSLPEETDSLLLKVLDFTNRALEREAISNAPSLKNLTTVPAFVIRLPNLQLFVEAEESRRNGQTTFTTDAGFVRFNTSKEWNGFFMVCMKKESVLLNKPEKDETGKGEDGEEGEDRKAKKGKGKRGKK